MANTARMFIIFLLIMAVFANNVYAYVDPGTGSYIFQVLIGFLVAGIFLIKTFFQSIKSFIFRIFGKEVDND